MTNLAQNDQANAFDFLGKAAPRYIQERAMMIQEIWLEMWNMQPRNNS